jgi:hypothetical protein
LRRLKKNRNLEKRKRIKPWTEVFWVSTYVSPRYWCS